MPESLDVRHHQLRSMYHPFRRWLSWPLIRHLRCLQFRRLRPLRNAHIFRDNHFYGIPIVRYYWAGFLEKYQADIRGRALEIGTTETIRQYGGSALTQAEAIDVTAHSDEVTVIADLTRADPVPSDTYDCFINQFTMHVIYDLDAALYHSIRLLKPGGVLLVNFSCVDYDLYKGLDMGTGAPLYLHWAFTPLQVANLLHRQALTEADYQLELYGNLFSRVAYQLNLTAEELTRHELEFKDPGHPLLICVRVVKPVHWPGIKPAYQEPYWLPKTTPVRWHPLAGFYGDAYE
jgi:SAM-dependent methyltransferase